MDPYTLRTFFPESQFLSVEQTPEYQLAQEIADSISSWFPYVAERPRWSFWYDQVCRSSTSTLLNFAEGWGRGRGHAINAWLISRGECYETAAGLSVGPPDLRQNLRHKVIELAGLISARLIDAEKHAPH